MKKGLIALLLILAAAAAAWFFFARPKPAPPAPGMAGEARREAGAGTDSASSEVLSSKAGERGRASSEVPPRRGGTSVAEPGNPAGGVTQPPELEPAPIKVRFDAPAPPELGKPAAVTLLVESSPKGWPAEVGPGAQLDLLLRLPVGVKLASEEGWSPAQLPAEEREDASGPWSVYEKKIPLQIKQGVPPEFLAKEKVELTVAEEGTNWIISARARLTQGSQTWQAFGVLFATLQGNNGQFHEIPKAPMDIQSAQAS